MSLPSITDGENFYSTSFFIIIIILFSLPFQYGYSELYLKNINTKCTFEYDNQNTKFPCYEQNIDRLDSCGSLPVTLNETAINKTLSPNVNFNGLLFPTVWKSKVQPHLMPRERYDNVGEPSIASNGSHVFYTGNHFAAKSVIGRDWSFVDPSFDFKGLYASGGNTTSNNTNGQNATTVNLFEADQRTMYDPYHNVTIWIRLGEPFAKGQITNILRLAISKDMRTWTVFDLIPIQIFNRNDIIDSQFDYPEATISKDFLYLTSSLIVGENCGKEYATIFRISLASLSNAITHPESTIPFYAVLDRNVTAITPVDWVPNNGTQYFGAQLKNISSMKIYEWKEASNQISNQTIPVASWNNIHISKFCGSTPSNLEKWWCKANTTTRIRSAWYYNNSLNFMWNSITSYDHGSSWKPYIEVATFNLNNNMSYERKYYVADSSRQWMFGSAIPSNDGKLGIIAYYITGIKSDPDVNPYMNLAFGIFNQTSSKWDMISLLNSTSPLPVKNEANIDDYNFGDFITIRQHPQNLDTYHWDVGAYVIVGSKYDDIDLYFIMIR